MSDFKLNNHGMSDKATTDLRAEIYKKAGHLLKGGDRSYSFPKDIKKIINKYEGNNKLVVIEWILYLIEMAEESRYIDKYRAYLYTDIVNEELPTFNTGSKRSSRKSH